MLAHNHPFWGENLEPLSCTPLSVPADRLVLSPHTYGPDVFGQPYFNDPTFPHNMAAIWNRHFGQFIDAGHAVILGEFGGKYGEGDPRDVQWQDTLVDYLVGKGVSSAFYWAWNPNSGDTGGILDDDWTWGHGLRRALPQTSPGSATSAVEAVEPADGLSNDLECHRRSFRWGWLVPATTSMAGRLATGMSNLGSGLGLVEVRGAPGLLLDRGRYHTVACVRARRA